MHAKVVECYVIVEVKPYIKVILTIIYKNVLAGNTQHDLVNNCGQF